MATPVLRLLRESLPDTTIGVLVRPNTEELLAGSSLVDEIHVEHAKGLTGPKRVAIRLRPQRYDAALLLANSFSSALVVRLASIPRRVGYDRDKRGALLTQRLTAPRRPDGDFAIIAACDYYYRAGRALLDGSDPGPRSTPSDIRMELEISRPQRTAAQNIIVRAGFGSDEPVAILNIGGNKIEKRWPPERFAQLADYLNREHKMRVLINGSPAESALCAHVASLATTSPIALPPFGVTLGSLKGLVQHASIMITNDTGPRHIAAALGTPVVSLFGPTDHRWTTVPAPAGEKILVADPTLDPSETADDHPERCRIDRIEFIDVIEAAQSLLAQ